MLSQDAENRRTGMVYDLAGRTSCIWQGWDSATAPTSCVWNPATYQATYTGPFREIAYAYTPNGKPSSLTDANNNLTAYQFDGFDRLQFTYFPDPATGSVCTAAPNDAGTPSCSGTQTYERSTYDAAGNVLTSRTRKGDSIVRTYDGPGRIETKAAAGLPTVTYTYTLTGEPLSMTSPAVSGLPAHAITHTYDSAGRRQYEDNLLGGQTVRVSYQYDQAGNRSRTTWSDAYFVHYQYDAMNRMGVVRENSATANEIAFYDYDILSRRKTLRYAGQAANQVAYTYEADSDLDVLTHTLASGTVSLDYGYDFTHRIRQISVSDNFYLPSPSTGTVAYAPTKLNGYASVAGDATSYDLSGNLTAWGPASLRKAYTYDSENRLRTASLNGSLVATYDYDPLGRRISKIAGGTTTYYQLDDQEEIAEYDSGGGALGGLLRRYVTGPGIDDRIARVEIGGAQAGKHYYRVNHQGSVIVTTNDSGGIRQQLAYDEYGRLTSQQPPASTTGEHFRYTGRRFDSETGLYHYRARYYSPELGRFLQTDPIGYEDDFNLYAYVGNDPVNAVDPTGTETASVTAFSSCMMTGGTNCGPMPGGNGESLKYLPFAAAAWEYDQGNHKLAAGLILLDAATFGRGSALRTAMQAAGVRFVKGEVAHHIVAQNLKDRFSKASRKLLQKYEIGIHEAVNGAKVPAWFHQGAGNFLHGAPTTKEIFKRLSEAAKAGPEAIRKELSEIGKAIEKAAKQCKKVTGSHICG